jgi:hypothetical protein
MLVVLFLIVFGVLIFTLFKLINSQFKVKGSIPKEKVIQSPKKTDLVEIHKDIYLESYGCFSSLEEKFFAKKLIGKEIDSGTVLSNNSDIQGLVKHVIDLGYDIYGYRMIHKYNNNYDNITIIELGTLGKLSGYSYISTYNYDEKTRGKVYLTYSPPLDKEVDIDDKNQQPSKPEKLDVIAKESSSQNNLCGYQCFSKDGKLSVNGKKYMCGSVGYPDIKTPTRYAVYKILERT